jgi:hypothetical protein
MSRARFIRLVVVGDVVWAAVLTLAAFLYLTSGFAPKQVASRVPGP